MNKRIATLVFCVVLAGGMTAQAGIPDKGTFGSGTQAGSVVCGIDTSPSSRAPKYPCTGDTGH